MPAVDFQGLTTDAWRIRDFLRVRVEKAFLQDLDSGLTKSFLFNPAEFEEAYSARYTQRTSPGLSHSRLQFENNPNAVITFTAVFDQVIFDEKRNRGERRFNRQAFRNPHFAAPNDVEEWRRFLLSIQYARKGRRLASVAPPPVLFVWPGMIDMRVRLASVRFRHTMFSSRKPFPRIFTAAITLIEDPLGRIFSEDMLIQGTHRPWAARLE